MYKVKKTAALALAIILVLGCFNIPPQMEAWANTTEPPDSQDPSPTPEPPTVTLYASPATTTLEYGIEKSVLVEVKARENITNLKSFIIVIPFDNSIFSINSATLTLSSELAALCDSPARYGGNSAGYVSLKYDGTKSIDIAKGRTLFSYTLVTVSKAASETQSLVINPSSATNPSSIICYDTDIINDPPVHSIIVNEHTPVKILGTVTPIIHITSKGGFPQVGCTLEATVENIAEAGVDLSGATITYRWYRRNGSIKTYYGSASTAASTYTTTVNDIGRYIGVDVVVSAPGLSGSGSMEFKEPIRKKDPPPEPGYASIIVTGVGDTWVELQANSLYEFALTMAQKDPADPDNLIPGDPPVGGAWQKSNVFTGLKPETTYFIWSRYAEAPDAMPSAAYRREDPVKTTPTAHQIELKTSGDNVNDPSSVYYSVVGGGEPIKGATVYLYAVPAEGYYFDHWEASIPGEKLIIQPYNPVSGETGTTLPSGAYIVMPDTDDKTVVTVVGYFKPKAQPTLVLWDRQVTYGQSHIIDNPVEFFDVTLLGGDGEASDKHKDYKTYLKNNIKFYYRRAGTENQLLEFPDYSGEANDEFQIDAGRYQIVAEYPGDVKNMPVRNEQMILEVLKAPGKIPAPPTIGIITENSIQILATNPAYKYIVDDGKNGAPPTDYSNWRFGTGGDIVWDGLFAAREYQVCVFSPGTDNYTESAVAITIVSTLHSWRASVREDGSDGKAVTSVYFFLEKDKSSPIPASKNIFIRNDASGTFDSIDIKMEKVSGPSGTENDDATDWFTIDDTSAAAAGVISGGSTSFEIKPDSGVSAVEGKYRAKITINATQAEPKSKEVESTSANGAIKDAVIVGLPYVFEVVLEVTPYPPIEITGLGDQYRTYNKQPQEVDTTKVGVEGGTLDKEDIVYTYAKITESGYELPEVTAPTNAGRYLVTAEPKAFTQEELDADPTKTRYSGRASAVLTISPKVLIISGLTAESREYDGTVNATLTGGVLKGAEDGDPGIYEGDEVSIKTEKDMIYNTDGIPAVGVFNTKNRGTDKPVYVGTGKGYTIELDGTDSANYQLTQPTLTASILSKPVVPTLPLVRKVYDGTTAIKAIAGEFRQGDVHTEAGDDLKVEFINCQTETANAGRGIQIVMGSMVVTGNGMGNYIVGLPTLPTAEIEPRGVFVTISGKSEVDYDGTPKSLTGTYEVCEGDSPNVEVTYNGVGVAPWLAGKYTIGAIIRDPNYEIIGDILGLREMTIRAGKLYYTDITRSVIPGDTSLKTIPLTAFNVTDSQGYAGIKGEYSIGTVIDKSGILADGYPKIEGTVISFRVKNSAKLDDEYAQIQVKFVPESGTYEQLDMYLQVMMAPEGYTNSIVNAPNTVNIGDSIDYTNIRLRTVFDSDGHIEDAVITDAMISSGYDKTDLRPSNLGLRNVVVSYPGNPLRTASFNILVVDVIEAFTIRAPDKLTYHWLIDQALDLTGGLLMPTMRTGSAADTVPLEAGMLSVSNSTLLKIGTYPVSVTYQKKIKNAAFTINVVEPPPINAQDPPTGADPGVLDVDPDTTFTDSAGKIVNFSNVQLVITPLAFADEAKLRSAIEEDNFFRRLPTDSIQVLDISLRDRTTGLDVEPDKPVTFRINYPSGTDRSTTLRILHVQRNDEWQVYPPTRREEGLEVTVQSFSPFAIGWMAGAYLEPEDPVNPTPTPGSQSPAPTVTITITPAGSASPSVSPTPGVFVYDSMTQSEIAFWEAVLDMIKSAQKGSVIRVNAKSYDKMPVEIMEAMVNSSDATLVISWNNGEDIVITSKTAFKPESTREYFPLSLLADLYGTEPPKTDDPDEGEEWLNNGNNSSSSSSSSSGGSGSNVNQPTVADTSRFREAMQDYIAQAVMNSNGNVYDIAAPDDPEHDLKPVTPQTAGWLTSDGENSVSEGILRPSLEKPSVSSPGLGALLIIIGAVLALAGAATGLYIFVSRKAADEE